MIRRRKETGTDRFKTMGNVFDFHTEAAIFKLMSEGHLDGLESPLSIGKEANIFTAWKAGKRIIVKIYRLETCDFNKMFDYIRYDTRYLGLKKRKRTVIFSWCQREFRNLLKAREANVRAPTPLTFKDNLLVMEFIGDNDAAPKLKDQYPKDPKKFYDSLVRYVRNFYKAGLVHGDLSEFNILNYNDEPVLIDFSQASPLRSANSEELLERDIKNINRFFSKIGVKVNEDLKKHITS
ncbi:MAG: serine protein kinase RIO [Candidatus Woesearchaeota archaeon]|nr:serine protein kinase RIO [Candidatus Woesearchaeota archaeon]